MAQMIYIHRADVMQILYERQVLVRVVRRFRFMHLSTFFSRITLRAPLLTRIPLPRRFPVSPFHVSLANMSSKTKPATETQSAEGTWCENNKKSTRKSCVANRAVHWPCFPPVPVEIAAGLEGCGACSTRGWHVLGSSLGCASCARVSPSIFAS